MRATAPVLVLSLLAAGVSADTYDPYRTLQDLDVIYVPTPQPVVEEMLRLAEVSGDDLLYDLGSGDGRIVITAAREFGARGVGIDIDPTRIAESEANAEEAGVTDKVQFIQGDLFEADLRPATAVTLYLLNSLNVKLRPKLLDELRPGTPVVSHDFDMGEWEPDEVRDVDTSRVYLWLIPAEIGGEWVVTLQDGEGEQHLFLQLDQAFQRVTGLAEAEGSRLQELSGRLKGTYVELSVGSIASGEVERHLTGLVEGGTITGTVAPGDDPGAPNGSWSARRTAVAAHAKTVGSR